MIGRAGPGIHCCCICAGGAGIGGYAGAGIGACIGEGGPGKSPYVALPSPAVPGWTLNGMVPCSPAEVPMGMEVPTGMDPAPIGIEAPNGVETPMAPEVPGGGIGMLGIGMLGPGMLDIGGPGMLDIGMLESNPPPRP